MDDKALNNPTSMVVTPQDQQQQGYLIDPKQILPGTITPPMLAATPVLASGDTYYSNGTTFVRLPVGTANQVLTTIGGKPSWQTLSIPTVVNPITKIGLVTTNFATTSVTYVDITGASISITTTVTCNMLVTMSGEWYNSGVHFNYCKLLRGTTELCENLDYQPQALAQKMFSMTTLDTAVAAGTYTYKAQMQVDAGTGTITGGAAGADNSRLVVIAFPN